MAKNVIKEIIISLLLCLAIILLLGILLYEYIPMSKTVPNPVSYNTPDNVKEELASETVDEEQIIMTYEVDSNDLNNYKRIQDYKPGKANPFSSFETTGTNTTTGNSANGTASNGTNTTGGNGTSTNNSGTSNSSNEENTSGGQFFQNKGTK